MRSLSVKHTMRWVSLKWRGALSASGYVALRTAVFKASGCSWGHRLCI